MIKIKTAIPFVPILKFNQIYFSKKPSLRGIVNNHYLMTPYTRTFPGFKRIPWVTKLIDLSQFDKETLLESFPKNNAYKIKRAEREDVKFEIEEDLNKFIDFYNEFALEKQLPTYSSKSNELNSENLVITKAVFKDETLVMHGYLYDKDIGRAILLRSASLFREENDTGKRNLISRANRYLHYKDMVYFMEKGGKSYDFGGYGGGKGSHAGIDRFKDSFNGQVSENSVYYPFWQFYLIQIWKARREKRTKKEKSTTQIYHD